MKMLVQFLNDERGEIDLTMFMAMFGAVGLMVISVLMMAQLGTAGQGGSGNAFMDRGDARILRIGQ